MGRPLKPIDENQVFKLAEVGCTNSEIAAFFDVTQSCICKRFSHILTKGRENGKTRLRMAQMKAAMAGNVAMLIWLGKNVLGQVDRLENINTGSPNFVVVVPATKSMDEWLAEAKQHRNK